MSKKLIYFRAKTGPNVLSTSLDFCWDNKYGNKRCNSKSSFYPIQNNCFFYFRKSIP